MSTLKYEFIQTANELSDESIKIMLDYMRTYIVPYDKMIKGAENSAPVKRKIGIFKGEKFLSDDYDFDEANEDIAKIFGVN